MENLLIKFYLTTVIYNEEETFSKHISSRHGKAERKDAGVQRLMEPLLKRDEAAP